MSALNFPANPANNAAYDVYTFSTGANAWNFNGPDQTCFTYTSMNDLPVSGLVQGQMSFVLNDASGAQVRRLYVAYKLGSKDLGWYSVQMSAA